VARVKNGDRQMVRIRLVEQPGLDPGFPNKQRGRDSFWRRPTAPC
jgi:hypothetical protein